MASQAFRASALGASAAASEGILPRAREILSAEASALVRLSEQLDDNFESAVHMLLQCEGAVVVTGIGKAGIVGRKLSASLASTGTPSHFLHPAEAVHGDLGSVRDKDVVLVLSYSGETEEITRLLPLIGQRVAMLAITARHGSTLGKAANVTLALGEHREACSLGVAPSTTTTAMMALGDALALIVSERRGFTREQFAGFHPAGNLGRQLASVCELMRPIEECRLANERQTLRQVIVEVSRPGRRTGAIMLTNDEGQLVGIFTDSDLARILERSQESKLDQSVGEVMTREFTTVPASCLLTEAMQTMARRKISELPVIDESNRPLGIIDVTDLVGVATAGLPKASTQEEAKVTALRVLRI